eukprot:Awhi_evm2s13058
MLDVSWISIKNGVEGVVSVTSIYKYYKKHGYNTDVLGASFRNTNKIEDLAENSFEKNLSVEAAQAPDIPKIHVTERDE